MKKLLLTLSLVLGFFTLAQAADPVTLPADSKTWVSYSWTTTTSQVTGDVDGYTFVIDKAKSSTNPKAPNTKDKNFNAVVVYAGSELTITAPAGTTFKQVVVKGAADSKAINATATGWTVSCSGDAGATFVATFTSETPRSSITFDGAGKQLRVGSITLGDGSGTVDPTPDPDPTPSVTEYDSFAGLAAAGTGAEGKVNGPVYFIYANATGTDVQVKDSKGGYMLVYRPASVPAGLVNGDAFAYVQGKYSPYNNLPEVASATFGEVTKGGAAVAPEEPGLDEISAAMANTYVKLSGVSISGLSGKNFTITDADGNTVKGYNTFNLEAIPEGENQTIIGFVRVYKTDVQIAPVSIEGGVVLEAVAEPTFSVAAGAVEKGTKVSISCATEGASIHYTTDGSDVSASSPVYNGTPIVINEAMTIKAIAVKEGMTDSKLAQAAYIIKADTPVEPISGTTATFDFTKPGELNPVVSVPQTPLNGDGVNVDGEEFTNNGITFKSVKKQSSKDLARVHYNKGWHLRSYSGNTMTISATNGYKLTSIVFEANAPKYATALSESTYSAGSYSNGTLNFAEVKNDVETVTITPNATVGINNITVSFAVKAPVLELPAGATEPMPLDNYTNAETNNYFVVKVSWPEGLTLHYETNCRGTQLDGVTLPYSEKQKALDFAAGNNADKTLTDPLTGDLTGAAAVSRSAGTNIATFGFASQGTFECYVVDAAGNKSDAKEISFTGKSTGVEDIVADGEKGEAVFYNMQGVRVANPAAGNLYIKVQGDKATKVLVK